jgi:GNAT superfamily N-acetyltransferase
VNEIRLPNGFRFEKLSREHPRRGFACGEAAVDAWLATKALQHQAKRLSITKVLLDLSGAVAGFYTLATGQIDFNELPVEMSKHLPRRMLPVAVLAWLGVDLRQSGQGLGRTLLASALRDCWEAGKTFPFVAIILDCLNDSTKEFYLKWDFAELPGNPFRLYLSATHLDAMMRGD